MLTKEEIRFARRPACKACRLDGACATPYMTGRGNDNSPLIAVVSDFPGPYEDKVGTLFTGSNGDLVRGILKDLGVVLNRDCYMTTTLRCKPADLKAKDTHIKLCKEYLIDDLIRVKPVVVVTLGTAPLGALIGKRKLKDERGAPRRVTLQSLTGGAETHEVTLIPTEAPGSVMRNGSLLKSVVKDLGRALQIAKDGGRIPEPPTVDYRVVHNEETAMQFMAEMRKAKRYAWDTETTGLNPFADDAKIVCFTFTTKPGTGWFIPIHTVEREKPKSVRIELSLEQCVDLVKWVFSLKRYVIGQNLKFDDLFVRRTLGFKPRSASFDCTIASHLVDEENSKHGPQGLKIMAYEHTQMGDYETKFLAKNPNAYKEMYHLPILDEEEPDASLLHYACADTDVAMQVCDSLTAQLKEENLMKTLSLEMQKAALLVDMEDHGARIDLVFNAELMQKFPDELEKIKQRLRDFPEVQKVERIIAGNSRQASFLEPEPFNPGSHDQVRMLCMNVLGLPPIEGKTTDTGKQQTDEESLDIWVSMLPENSVQSEILGTLVEYRKLQKLFGTYVRPLSEIVDSNGYVHTSFNSVGTVTWRLASSGPNLQNLPRAEDERRGWIKKQFVGGKEGWWVAEADYSQIELRILALVSQDEKLIEAYINDEDIHRKTAAHIFNCDEIDVTKVQRTRGKIVNFSVIYGKTAEGLATDLGITVDEAERYLGAFYGLYAGAAEWIEETRNFALENGYTQTLFGHKRRLDNVFSKDYTLREKALRQGVNAVIQGTASNMAIYAEMYLNKLLQREGFQSYCFGQVHDSVWVTGPEEEREVVTELIVNVLENLPFEFLTGDDERFPNVPPIIADIAVGPNLLELVAVKK